MAQPIRAIPINPGGVLAAKHVVGRDGSRDEILRVLETRSVVLTGERRLGKTSLALLVAEEAHARDWTVVQLSAEGRRDLDALTAALITEFERRHGRLRRFLRTVGEHTSVTAGPVSITPGPLQPSFEEVVEAALEQAGQRLLLIIDELPLFARDLNDATPQTQEGTAALHLLRQLRQTHSGLRMLCLGSIGFHHVVRDGSGVLNDTEKIRLTPLSTLAPDPDAEFLARCLLHGADRIAALDTDAVVAAIATEVDGLPFYIHKIVATAEIRGGAVDAELIELIVAEALAAPDDPWHLRHYRERVDRYYGDDAPIARALLDALAHSDDPLSFADLQRLLSSHPLAPVDDERVRDVLERLEDDHYLVRIDGRRSFAFSLVRRAWKEQRR